CSSDLIASNTKAFTTAALAMLVDEGKLAWDDPVTKYLPDFQLYDPYVTREFTIRDLVTHRSGLGLGAGDLLWFHSNYDRAEIIHRIRAAKPASSFRSRYAYDNVLYIAAGEIVAAVSGKSWDDFITQRILAPLGMTESGTRVAVLSSTRNVAAPHGVEKGKLQVVPRDSIDNTGPAGGIVSNVSDMAKWLLCRRGSGWSFSPTGSRRSCRPSHIGCSTPSSARRRPTGSPHSPRPSSWGARRRIRSCAPGQARATRLPDRRSRLRDTAGRTVTTCTA